MNTIPTPAQLWEGDEIYLCEEVFLYLRQHFCEKNLPTRHQQCNCFCSECKKIRQHKHPSILWFNPTKSYLIDDINLILRKTAFQLDERHNFFFVLQKANLLSRASANRLLKVLEEPPTGYHFILLTSNKQDILPTVVSRCLVRSFPAKTSNGELHPLLSFFWNKNKHNQPREFEHTLKQLALSDSESSQLIQDLYEFFATKLITIYKKQSNMTAEERKRKQYIENVLNFLKQSMRYPSQSGSSTIFWKNFYLSFPKQQT